MYNRVQVLIKIVAAWRWTLLPARCVGCNRVAKNNGVGHQICAHAQVRLLSAQSTPIVIRVLLHPATLALGFSQGLAANRLRPTAGEVTREMLQGTC